MSNTFHNCNVAVVPSEAEREARIWAVLETELGPKRGATLYLYTVGVQWCCRLGNGPEHFGESRLDALAQLAQCVALR